MKFSWQGGGRVEGEAPESAERRSSGGGGAVGRAVCDREGGTIGCGSMVGVTGVLARRKRRLRNVRRLEPSTFTLY